MEDWKPPKFGSPVWVAIPAPDVERCKNMIPPVGPPPPSVTPYSNKADPFHAAHKFYSTVFNWTFKDAQDLEENPPERLRMMDFRPDIELSGGIVKVPEPTGVMKPGVAGVVVYYLVEDVDKIGTVIEEAGGKMLSDKQKEGKSGVFRLFQDPDGTVGGVYQILM